MNQADIMQQFIDSANAGMYLKDDEGRFLMVNRRMTVQLKASKEEIIGKTDYDFFPKEEADRLRVNDHQVTEAGVPMNFTMMADFADGQQTIFDHKFPVPNIEGAPNAVGGIAITVTKTES